MTLSLLKYLVVNDIVGILYFINDVFCFIRSKIGIGRGRDEVSYLF